jgi:hypothetical protein
MTLISKEIELSLACLTNRHNHTLPSSNFIGYMVIGLFLGTSTCLIS